MLARVVEDVDERVTHFTRRPQQARVVAIAPDASAPTEDAVDRLRQSNREALDAAREPCDGIRLDDEMQVVALHAVVQDAEAWCPERSERMTDRRYRVVVAERGEVRRRAKGDVRRATTVVRLTPPMRYGATSRQRRTSGAAATATPGAEWELELSKAAVHVNMAYITN
jgi:hypothetical protein